MRTRTQRWWLAGGLLLALVSGGSALQSSVRLAQASQTPGHSSQLQAGYGIGGKPLAGVIWDSTPLAGVIWGTTPVAVTHPHSPSADGFGIGGKTITGFGISGRPVAQSLGSSWSGPASSTSTHLLAGYAPGGPPRM